MFDPTIERLSDDELVVNIIKNCASKDPSNEERQFVTELRIFKK